MPSVDYNQPNPFAYSAPPADAQRQIDNRNKARLATRCRRTPADPNAQVRPYNSRTFAAYDRAGTLLAVTVYKRGARAIVERLNALESEVETLRAQLAARA